MLEDRFMPPRYLTNGFNSGPSYASVYDGIALFNDGFITLSSASMALDRIKLKNGKIDLDEFCNIFKDFDSRVINIDYQDYYLLEMIYEKD